MARTDLTHTELEFLREPHFGTLTTLRGDGTPHVTAIAFTYGHGTVRIIASDATQKVRNIERTGYAAVCQVDGPRWLALEGPAVVRRDAEGIATAVDAFTEKFRPPRVNPKRIAIEIGVERVLGGV
jgi:PPOX class probable F420-dependent enzyme